MSYFIKVPVSATQTLEVVMSADGMTLRTMHVPGCHMTRYSFHSFEIDPDEAVQGGFRMCAQCVRRIVSTNDSFMEEQWA